MPQNSPPPEGFATTHWSVIHAAGRRSSHCARQAMEQLCTTYWPPVYGFLRRHGHTPTDAEDLTQAFFVHLLDSEFVQVADPDRGRFRSFLLKSVTNFVSADRRAQQALKRGGNGHVLSLDLSAGEELYRTEQSDTATPEQQFERRWALTILQRTMHSLRTEYEEKNHKLLFESLEPHLNQDAVRTPYAELSTRLHMTEDSIKQSTRRLKLRYRELLRSEIASTVSSPDEIDDELRQLLSALS